MRFEVVNCSNQIEAQIEAFASIAITIAQDMKNFQSSNNVFAEDSLAGQCAVSRFLLRGEGLKLGFLRRDLTVGMHVRQTQVAGIG